MCLADAVVASWSLTQKVAGSSPFIVMTNIFVTEFRENSTDSLNSGGESNDDARIFQRGGNANWIGNTLQFYPAINLMDFML